MGQVNSPSKTEVDQSEIKISFEEFIQIVEAVLEGRYSWACVLFLRFAGFNPLHYIPYRTYNRLVKLKLLDSTSKGNHNFTDNDFNQNRISQSISGNSPANEEIITKIATKLIDGKKNNQI